MERERKLFEKWWNAHFSLGFREDDDKALRHKGVEYYDLETQMMWLAWQGRAAEGERMRDAMQTVVMPGLQTADASCVSTATR